ncbi:hypothetical protein CYY_003322 [Polysphondylium violaceum]|uniref:Uncharacterized protein n=1 Tax=Polysphondylium violaceum TaxID=133409 RepID=A0A8J4UUD4_9MYCE|nr:hypothetical protein CYY_003322 [Polysphondylium violaceum]
MTDTTTDKNNNYLIPIGFIARNDDKENPGDIRFYTDEITLDSSIFIFKTQSRLSFIHIDANVGDNEGSLTLDHLVNEIEYVQVNNQDSRVEVWRCHNIPVGKEAVAKQKESNNRIEKMWGYLEQVAEKLPIIDLKLLNVVETVSMSHSDKEPQLPRISPNQLAKSIVSQKLLNAVSLISDFVSPNLDKKVPDNLVIFENGTWNATLIQEITTPNPLANEMVTVNPNLYSEFIAHFLTVYKGISTTEINNFIDNLFESINLYREYTKIGGNIKKVKVGANENCPCASKQKFKKCHGTPKSSVIRKFYLSY